MIDLGGDVTGNGIAKANMRALGEIHRWGRIFSHGESH
jgi:hypothetical protein